MTYKQKDTFTLLGRRRKNSILYCVVTSSTFMTKVTFPYRRQKNLNELVTSELYEVKTGEIKCWWLTASRAASCDSRLMRYVAWHISQKKTTVLRWDSRLWNHPLNKGFHFQLNSLQLVNLIVPTTKMLMFRSNMGRNCWGFEAVKVPPPTPRSAFIHCLTSPNSTLRFVFETFYLFVQALY